jgi:hypothetical protein
VCKVAFLIVVSNLQTFKEYLVHCFASCMRSASLFDNTKQRSDINLHLTLGHYQTFLSRSRSHTNLGACQIYGPPKILGIGECVRPRNFVTNPMGQN